MEDVARDLPPRHVFDLGAMAFERGVTFGVDDMRRSTPVGLAGVVRDEKSLGDREQSTGFHAYPQPAPQRLWRA